MKYVSNNSGDIFENEEAAREDMLESMTYEDYASYIDSKLPYAKLLQWAFEHGFAEENYDIISETEEEFFIDWYEEYEDEEFNKWYGECEDEEEDF